MVDFLLRWCVSTFAGFLIGLCAAVWLDPQTTGGFILILITCIALSVTTSALNTAIRSIVAGYRGSTQKSGESSASVTLPSTEVSTLAGVAKPQIAPAAPAGENTAGKVV